VCRLSLSQIKLEVRDCDILRIGNAVSRIRNLKDSDISATPLDCMIVAGTALRCADPMTAFAGLWGLFSLALLSLLRWCCSVPFGFWPVVGCYGFSVGLGFKAGERSRSARTRNNRNKLSTARIDAGSKARQGSSPISLSSALIGGLSVPKTGPSAVQLTKWTSDLTP
jgi:hypothetical protein